MISRALPTPYYRPYANLAAPIITRDDDPYRAGTGDSLGASARRACACAIVAFGAGTAVIRPPWGAGGGANDVTLTLAAGVPQYFVIGTVVSGTATNVVLSWPLVSAEN